jgi:uncharacterized protein YgiM (DUF1202 family)/outer membrane lipoprotein SlyB
MLVLLSIRPPKILAASAAVILAISFIGSSPVNAKAPKVIDDCAQLRKPFSAIRDYRQGRIVKGVVGGALAGLAIAGLKDALNGKKKGGDYGTAIVAGAVAGGLVGYITSKRQAGLNREQMRAAIDGDLQQDVDQFWPIPGHLVALGNCRRAQIYRVEQDAKANLYSKQEATKRIAKIERWIEEDDRLISKAAGQQAKTVTTYSKLAAMADGIDPQQAEQEGFAVSNFSNGADEYGDEFDIEMANAVEAALSPPSAKEPIAETMVVAASSGGNLRAAPSPDAAIVTALARGTKVAAQPSETSGWSQVTVDGQSGFMRDDLLATESAFAARKLGAKAVPSGSMTKRVEVAPVLKPQSTVGLSGRRQVTIRPATRKPEAPSQKVTAAIAAMKSLDRARSKDKAATLEQLQAARAGLEI